MKEDMVKSKSLDTEAGTYYNKIVETEPLPEDENNMMVHKLPDGIEPDFLPDDLPKYDFEKIPSHYTPQSNNAQDKKELLKESFMESNEKIKSFKKRFYDYISDEYFSETDCYVEIVTDDCIDLYADLFNSRTINKINRLSSRWDIVCADSTNLYNLRMRIGLEDWK